MTRKFLDTLRAELPVTLPDNTSGLITPAALRGVLRDIIDSTVNDIIYVFRSAGPIASVPVQAAPAIIPNVFDTAYIAVNMDGAAADAPAGFVTLGTVAGRQYWGALDITFETAANNQINFGVFFGGAYQSITLAGAEGQGTGNPVGVNAPFYINKSLASDVVYPVMWRPAGAGTISIDSIRFTCTILPTNNP